METNTLDTYALKVCRSTCPHALQADFPVQTWEQVLQNSGWPQFLTSRFKKIRHHHQFKIAVALCPNGCVQPHIADFALIATAPLVLDMDKCHQCGLCVDICREKSLKLEEQLVLTPQLCLGCMACVRLCPTQALTTSEIKYRVLLGGKLGRHPRLAHELGQFTHDQALVILAKTLKMTREHFQPGQRLGALIDKLGVDKFNSLVQP